MEFSDKLTRKAVIVVAFSGYTMHGELPIGKFVKAKPNVGNLHMWRTNYVFVSLDFEILQQKRSWYSKFPNYSYYSGESLVLLDGAKAPFV